MKLTKKDAAVVALAGLGGAANVIDTEDAAIAAHEIDPIAFGWKKHPDRVDLDMVRTTLRHEGESRDPRIEGSIQNGWHLTPRGVQWVEANPALLAGTEISIAETSAAAQTRRAETREAGAAVNRVLTSDAFKLWARGREFTARQAAQVFRIDEYTPAQSRRQKAAQLRELVRSDSEAEAFVMAATDVALQLSAPVARQKDQKEENSN